MGARVPRSLSPAGAAGQGGMHGLGGDDCKIVSDLVPSVHHLAHILSRFQMQESLNPNNLEYWMEDIYTPGYDSLLKRKEAEFRRAKVCKMAALIAAAACTVILVIVVPICTMKS